jgi:hypothetical protein
VVVDGKDGGSDESLPSGAAASEDADSCNSASSSPDRGVCPEGSGLAEGALGKEGVAALEIVKKEKTTDFVNFVCQRTGAKPSVFNAVWKAMLQEAPAYLLEEGKPINLGIGELYALPYRANWREIMEAKFPRLALALKKTPPELMEPFLINVGWMADLYSSDLVEMKSGDKHYGWCIAFAPNAEWFKIVRAYEKQHRAELGAKKYADRFCRQVSRFSKRILKYFLNHVTQTSIPCAAVRYGGSASGDYLVPHIPKGKVRPTAPKVTSAHIVSNHEEAEAEKREAGALYGSFKEVPPLPLIPSTPKDMWERGDGGNKK